MCALLILMFLQYILEKDCFKDCFSELVSSTLEGSCEDYWGRYMQSASVQCLVPSAQQIVVMISFIKYFNQHKMKWFWKLCG